MTKYRRETTNGEIEYFDGQHWFEERHVCHHCLECREAEGLPYQWADEQYSFGVYAGRYCDKCWRHSGFRDATDPTARFDELDAGEHMDETW